jgi:diguanylate cyclase (GGDEF)-like protein
MMASRLLAARRAVISPAAPAWLLFALGGGVAAALYLVAVPEDLKGPWYDAFGLVAAATVVLHVVARGLRPAWVHLMLALALLLLGLGDVAFTALAATGAETFPSVADAIYIVGGLTLITAIWARYGRRGDASVLIEALILMSGGVIVLWEGAVEPILNEASDPVATAVALAYPMIDILLLGILARVLLIPGRITGSTWLVTAGATCYLVADVIYATQVVGAGYEGGLLDAGWLIGYVLFAASVLHPSSAESLPMAPPGHLDSRPRLMILGPVLVLGPISVIGAELAGDHEDIVPLALSSFAIATLVVLRLAIALRALRGSLEQRHRLQVELEHQANHDALTGLANRSLFAARLQDALLAGRATAVLFVDLDDFKAVNDTFGHEAGDQLLQQVAGRIEANLRADDLAARFGGDEFAVLLLDVDHRGAAEQTAKRLLEALRVPVAFGDRVAVARASIGVAQGRGGDSDVLMRNADIAMYLAKSQGKDRLQAFDERMHADVLARLQVRADLERAIERREFVVHYQPIVDVESGGLVGTEALVRWQHPTRGLLPPSEFIEVAESTGLIVPLGLWILGEAITTTRRWHADLGLPDLTISVNVSPRQFEHPGFAGAVAASLQTAGLPPRLLTLEITESSIVDTEAVAAILRDLKRLGIRIAVDDFGTGYSSLSYVGRLPIDELKIDRAFVAALGSKTKEAALAASVIEIGAKLDLVTVAEGIEEWSQLERLRALGCGLGQGFLFARPMSSEAFEAFVRLPSIDRRSDDGGPPSTGAMPDTLAS